MLATVHARALDARAAHPVLGDAAAVRAVAALDADRAGLGVAARDAISVAMRAKLFDRAALVVAEELEAQVPGLRLVRRMPALLVPDAEDLRHAPRSFRRQFAVIARLPLVGDVGHLSRYAFG
jgi:hypothetical protein